MVGVLEVLGAGGAVGLITHLFDRWRGCTRGHVWGDWEPTDRWQVLPVCNTDSVCVDREYERSCQRDNCTATETEYHGETHEVYSKPFVGLVEELSEVHYECPHCRRQVPNSNRETDWQKLGGFDGGRERWEECPQCEQSYPSEMWSRVPYEEVSP